ncbi:Motile sperm domain-containing protein 2-like protein [Dinothrombium tinctorium]|uniref:Motile sperm domain-containing protein 2-like protein n=1 Tax=Dinothrombium tinctorium TaxID=1965070 RepID=A0A443RK26_9ACAR|nr:Motile sperm domain-containing protein 2-like protein [Dinothrombium tinctorium]
MLKTALKIRKEFRVPTTKDYEFPIEFYKSGGLFPYERDKKGNLVVYMRVALHKKIPELDIFEKAFLLHVFEKVDKITKGQFVVVFDMTDAGYENVDWDFLKFLLENVRHNFPIGLKYVLVTNLHWMLNTLRRAAFALMPTEFVSLIKFASGEEIFEYIDKENLPDFLGGTCKRNYMAVPRGSKSIYDVCEQFGYQKEIINKYMPRFKALLDEADAKLASGNLIDPVDYFDEPPEQEEIEEIKKEAPLQLEPEQLVQFYFDHNQNCFMAQILIHNISEQLIAFKVQSNCPKNYLVSPRLGILRPKTSLELKIQLLPGFENRIKCGRFLVLAAETKSERMSLEDFQRLWQNDERLFKWKLSSTIYSNESQRNEEEAIANEDPVDSLRLELSKLRMKYETLRRRQLQILISLTLLFILSLILLFIYFTETRFETKVTDFVAHNWNDIRQKYSPFD